MCLPERGLVRNLSLSELVLKTLCVSRSWISVGLFLFGIFRDSEIMCDLTSSYAKTHRNREILALSLFSSIWNRRVFRVIEVLSWDWGSQVSILRLPLIHFENATPTSSSAHLNHSSPVAQTVTAQRIGIFLPGHWGA